MNSKPARVYRIVFARADGMAVIVAIAADHLKGRPVDLVTMRPVEALNLAEQIIGAARVAITNEARSS